VSNYKIMVNLEYSKNNSK